MGAKIPIKQLMQERHITVKDMADKLDINSQSMANKLYRDKFPFSEVVKIADMLNADVKIITRDTKKEFF